MRHFITLGMIILLTSCVSNTNYYSQTMKSWQGVSEQDLVKKWGQPEQIRVNQNGNAYLYYKTTSYRPGYAPISPSIGVNRSTTEHPVIVSHANALGGGRSQTLDCVAIFEVNSKHTIIHTQYMGNGCFGSENFAKRLSNNH